MPRLMGCSDSCPGAERRTGDYVDGDLGLQRSIVDRSSKRNKPEIQHRPHSSYAWRLEGSRRATWQEIDGSRGVTWSVASRMRQLITGVEDAIRINEHS